MERAGVCRTSQHLALTFCRCIRIPARYATGYLGDIGVPPVSVPWISAAGLKSTSAVGGTPSMPGTTSPRIGRVLMARGRDAADVAMTTSFGKNTLQCFKVWTDEVT